MFKNKFPGNFIAVEGLSGAGASTQVSNIQAYLNGNKTSNFITLEPTNNVIGGIVKGCLAKDWKIASPLALQLLFAADRANHLEMDIKPKLEKGVTVISNRYFLSSLAYGAVEINDQDWLYQINSQFMLPDLTILIKVPAKTCMERIKGDNLGLELFNNEEKLSAVWKNYEAISKKYPNIKIIDGEKNREEVFAEIKKEIDKLF